MEMKAYLSNDMESDCEIKFNYFKTPQVRLFIQCGKGVEVFLLEKNVLNKINIGRNFYNKSELERKYLYFCCENRSLAHFIK
jgi:hypothetical protein